METNHWWNREGEQVWVHVHKNKNNEFGVISGTNYQPSVYMDDHLKCNYWSCNFLQCVSVINGTIAV